MITFYPGPSKVYQQVRQYMLDAYDSGILSANHRSSAFMELCEQTLCLLHLKLHIPEDYSIVFVSSATECWEIIAQSFTPTASHHYYNGAFGQKWYEYARKIIPKATGSPFDTDQELLVTDEIVVPDKSVICVTQNETSNGTQLSKACIRQLRRQYPKSLLAVDATSSLGGVDLEMNQGDIWFASVQKCLGLPAGMGLLIVSPKAMEQAKMVSDHRFYNSFLFMNDNIQKFQTHYTPNVLAVYLLMRVLEEVQDLNVIAARIQAQAAEWYRFFNNHSLFKPLVNTPSVRSATVITIGADTQVVSEIKKKTLEAGIVVGNGYGDWKSNSFRIANFPAITPAEIGSLQEVLDNIHS